MDPTTCYRHMHLAMLEGDMETARELALSLKRWLHQGGFEPEGENLLEVKGHLARVLRITTPGVPPEPEIFSLTCSECDYGEGITTEAEAIEEGWSQITPAADLPMANFVGICPCCRNVFDGI